MNLGEEHIEKLYNLSEINLKWFNLFHPEEEVNFSDLLELNYRRLKKYIMVDKLNVVTDSEIDKKLDKMDDEFNNLFDISYSIRKKDRNSSEKIL